MFLLLNVGVEALFVYPGQSAAGDKLSMWSVQGLALCALLGLVPAARLYACRVAALLIFAHVVFTFPLTANHAFLGLVCMSFVAFLDDYYPDERELLGQALRWITAIFFFYSGFQKLLYGYYFDGQFLGYFIGFEERFSSFFGLMLPESEVQRLQAAAVVAEGAGPYRVDSGLFVVMSNLVYVFEMAAAIFLVVPRTRTIAALASIGFVIMIELGAREVIFGFLTVNLLLLFLPGPWNARLFPLFVVMHVLLVLSVVGILPRIKIVL